MSKVTHSDGRKEWTNREGLLHRMDGPAVKDSDGHVEYWLNGELHRIGGPAIKYPSGHKEYWVHGRLHALDGPAVIYANGRREYWIEGELHRNGGKPAIEYPTGDKAYYDHGELIRFEKFKPHLEVIDTEVSSTGDTVDVVAVVNAHGVKPTLLMTHSAAAHSANQPCIIHNRNPVARENVEGWPYLWRLDRGFFERICPHGIGHPDPDYVAYLAATKHDGDTVHGCDGCCYELSDVALIEAVEDAANHPEGFVSSAEMGNKLDEFFENRRAERA